MTQPDNDTDQTTFPEDDDPRSLTGDPAPAPDDAVEGGLYEDGEL